MTHEEQAWRFSLRFRLGVVALFGGFGIFSTAMIVTKIGSGFGSALIIDGVLLVLTWRTVLVPFISVDDEDATVQNPLRRYRLALADITNVHPTELGICIECDDGQRVYGWAVQAPRWRATKAVNHPSFRVTAAIQEHARRAGAHLNQD
jgi:hypothetical protein